MTFNKWTLFYITHIVPIKNNCCLIWIIFLVDMYEDSTLRSFQARLTWLLYSLLQSSSFSLMLSFSIWRRFVSDFNSCNSSPPLKFFLKAIEQGKLDLRMGRYCRYEEQFQGWELGRGRSDKWEEANVLFELVFASIDWILFNLSMRSFIQCIPYYLSIRKQDNKS